MRDNPWFEDKRTQIDVTGMHAFGIPISTRHGKARELAELLQFAEEAAKANVNSYVQAAHYDSNSDCCSFTLDRAVQQHSTIAEALLTAALKTITQFEWFGVVQHGRGAPPGLGAPGWEEQP